MESLTHTSYAVENNCPNYQRLEFLGDAILNTYTATKLFKQHMDWMEGELTRARASVVSEGSLAQLAKTLKINECLRLGRGEAQSGGAEKSKILADVFEALTAVIYLAKGIEGVWKHLDSIRLLENASSVRDSKSELQQVVQNRGSGTPYYTILNSEGPSHNPTFEVAVQVGNDILGKGTGRSKREAEQNAASNALDNLK